MSIKVDPAELPAVLGLEAWRQCWATLDMPGPREAVYLDLLQRHREPHRHYHTLQHLAECMVWLVHAVYLAQRPAEVQLALWFHDAIYEVRASDNEARSADLAVATLREVGADDATCGRIRQLILATRHDAVPSDPDARLLVDIDLAILGANAIRYAEYERQVREEYAWVPRWIFRRKRREILQGFLSRPAIYSNAFFAERLESAARRNLAQAVADLGG